MEEASTGAAVVGVGVQEEDDSAVASWLIVDEETATELSNLLDLFEAPPPIKVRFIDDPYSSLVVFQSSTAYVTINGNEESCGSSFSDSDSSVMASIDVGCGAARRCGGAWWIDGAEAREWWIGGSADVDVDMELEGFLTDGCDDDATWMNFLSEI